MSDQHYTVGDETPADFVAALPGVGDQSVILTIADGYELSVRSSYDGCSGRPWTTTARLSIPGAWGLLSSVPGRGWVEIAYVLGVVARQAREHDGVPDAVAGAVAEAHRLASLRVAGAVAGGAQDRCPRCGGTESEDR